MYIYKTTIYTDTTDVLGLNVSQNNTDVTDFEGATKKPNADAITDIVIEETTFVSELSYTDFDALVTGALDWTDVKYIEGAKDYCLYLSSNTAL